LSFNLELLTRLVLVTTNEITINYNDFVPLHSDSDYHSNSYSYSN